MSILKPVIVMYCAIAILVIATSAPANEFTCYVEANNTDVFVKIFDIDRDNDNSERIWLGRLSDGESVQINSSQGLLTYYYTTEPDEDEPLKGGVDRLCDNDRTIAVP